MGPAWDLEVLNASRLLRCLGSFWSEFYAGREVLREYIGSLAELWCQNWNDLREAIACLSRQKVPVWHRQFWYLWVVRKSEAWRDWRRFNTGGIFNGSWNYDERTDRIWAWELPRGCVRVPWLANRISRPSRVWVEGLDYQIQKDLEGRIWLVTWRNLFEDSSWAQRQEQDDVAVYLWLADSLWERRYLARSWGTLLQQKRASSEEYRAWLNVWVDLLQQGSPMLGVTRTYSLATGLPLAWESGERVEQVLTGPPSWVVTDRRTYELRPGSVALVSSGEVWGGQALSDALEVWELRQGILPPWGGALRLNDLLLGDYEGDLTVRNDSVSLSWAYRGGKLRVRFPLDGLPQDIEKFWQQVESREDLSGVLLAELLDIRTVRSGPTEPIHLPAQVRPLEFLVQQLWRCQMYWIRVRWRSWSKLGLGWDALRYLSRVLPVASLGIWLIDLEALPQRIVLDQWDLSRPTARSTIRSFPAAPKQAGLVTESQLPHRVRVWLKQDAC